ncbi:hypothetical protein B296_00008725 [Ensete ventricosum]|uniref:Uncharacterized protein n=1 Tax=Ensete ventricosum TaxID=4639 RepID=A0A426ZR68_ENSVE|nr:hypothetical protein B296_00008725 [Ensete ventricosum]
MSDFTTELASELGKLRELLRWLRLRRGPPVWGYWSLRFAWTWLVRPRKASTVTTNDAGRNHSPKTIRGRHCCDDLLGWLRVVRFR